MRSLPGRERAVFCPRSAMARPGPPDDGRVCGRPRARPQRTPGSDRLLGDWMPLWQQWFRIVHTSPQGLGRRRAAGPGWLVSSGRLARATRSGAMRTAVLHAMDRERPAAVLQVPRHAVGSAGPPGQRSLRCALPTARQSPHRLPRAGTPTQARVAVCGSMPPRSGHHHHRAADRGLDHPHGHRRRRDLATGLHPTAVAGTRRPERR